VLEVSSDKIEWCNTLPGLSDHEAVHVKFSAGLHKSKQLHKKAYMYRNADWESLKERINCVSERYYQLNLSSTRSVDQNWHYINHELLKAIQDFIPTRLLSNRSHLP